LASSFPRQGPCVRASSPCGATHHGSNATLPCPRLKGRRPNREGPNVADRSPPRAPALIVWVRSQPRDHHYLKPRCPRVILTTAVRASGRRRCFRPDSASSKLPPPSARPRSAPPVRCHTALSSTPSWRGATLPCPPRRLSPCRRPHPFRSPCRTPSTAALLHRLHPELGSAAFLAPVRSPSCSLLASLVYTVVRCHAAFSSVRCRTAAPSCPCGRLGSALRPPRTLGREPPCTGPLPRSRIGPRAAVHERAGQIRPSTVELFSIFQIYIQILAIQKFV
jgi:hypothetical protein